MAEPQSPDELGGIGDDGSHTAAEGVDAPADPPRSGPDGIIGVLLHTEPAVTVAEVQRELGVSASTAHFVCAGRKALDAMLDGPTEAGTTVAEHLIAGSVTLSKNMAEGDEGDTSDDSEGDTSEPTDNTDIPGAAV